MDKLSFFSIGCKDFFLFFREWVKQVSFTASLDTNLIQNLGTLYLRAAAITLCMYVLSLLLLFYFLLFVFVIVIYFVIKYSCNLLKEKVLKDYFDKKSVL